MGLADVQFELCAMEKDNNIIVTVYSDSVWI